MRMLFYIGFATALASSATAQMKVETVHVRVLNGRNAKPIKRAHATVNVLPLTKYETPTSFTANAQGNFSLLVLTTAHLSTAIAHHAPCQSLSKADRKRPPTPFSVAEILQDGVVSPNTCGHPRIAPQPGVLSLFVRPAHWWQRFAF